MPKVGIVAGLYVNTGTYVAPVWTEVELVGDAAVNPSWEEGDATTRQSVVNQAEQTKMALEVTGRIRVPDGVNVPFDKFEKSFIGRTLLDILALNGKKDIPGVRGYRLDGKLFNWTEDQALGNVLFKDFNIKPAPSDNIPKFVEIQSDGTPTFFDIGSEEPDLTGGVDPG